jgi:hypothetical protein
MDDARHPERPSRVPPPVTRKGIQASKAATASFSDSSGSRVGMNSSPTWPR